MLLTALPAGGEPRVNLKTVYYDVAGRNLEEIRKELDLKSPVRHGDERFHANTSWSVTWNMRWMAKAFSCEVTDVTAQVDITVTLPRWPGLEDAPREAGEEWHRYYGVLVEHENGHRDLAIEAGKKIEEGIRRMGARENCATMKSDANRIGRGIVRTYEALSEKYDEETDHGRKPKTSGP
ncbi:MAG TPA: DUF922 domain-containing protein [Candidatus Binatia bacterium]